MVFFVVVVEGFTYSRLYNLWLIKYLNLLLTAYTSVSDTAIL